MNKTENSNSSSKGFKEGIGDHIAFVEGEEGGETPQRKKTNFVERKTRFWIR